MYDFNFFEDQFLQYRKIHNMLNAFHFPVVSQITQMESVVKQMMSSLGVISNYTQLVKGLETLTLSSQIKVTPNWYDKMKSPLLNISSSAVHNQINSIIKAYQLWNVYSDEESEEEIQEDNQVNEKIVTEILQQNTEKNLKENSPIIVLSPVNEKVLRYLAENPQVLYQLHDREFEKVMAEIYCKLGYKVDLTQSTHDGGKDIIIRKPEVLGDFVYYVECKKFSPSRKIGVGIIRNLVGTVNTDRVNGGILATTSFFTRDAKKFIINNKLDFQIQTHDYNKIRDMLNAVI